jgi:putative DNA primase/helicase
VPPFEDALLPEALRSWVADVAARVQGPADFVAIGAMVSAAAVIGRKVAIRPKRQDDWAVVPNLWGLAVGPPGLMKSPALAEALRPLSRLISDTAESAAGSSDGGRGQVWIRSIAEGDRVEAATGGAEELIRPADTAESAAPDSGWIR